MAVSRVSLVNNTRTRSLVLPREHGAWGILLIPLLTAAVVGFSSSRHTASLGYFVLTTLGLFWLRTPVESLLGTAPLRAQTAEEKRTVWLILLLASSLALGGLAGLFWGGRNAWLVAIGGVSALAFIAQAVVKKIGRRARMAAQIIGAIGLTSTAAGAYYVVTGQLDSRALALWVANWVFAGDQIHFVQLRIRGSRLEGWRERMRFGRSFFAGQIAVVIAALLAGYFRWLPLLCLVALVPALFRGTLWFFRKPQSLNVHRLGVSELGYGVTFGLLLTIGFLFA